MRAANIESLRDTRISLAKPRVPDSKRASRQVAVVGGADLFSPAQVGGGGPRGRRVGTIVPRGTKGRNESAIRARGASTRVITAAVWQVTIAEATAPNGQKLGPSWLGAPPCPGICAECDMPMAGISASEIPCALAGFGTCTRIGAYAGHNASPPWPGMKPTGTSDRARSVISNMPWSHRPCAARRMKSLLTHAAYAWHISTTTLATCLRGRRRRLALLI